MEITKASEFISDNSKILCMIYYEYFNVSNFDLQLKLYKLI